MPKNARRKHLTYQLLKDNLKIESGVLMPLARAKPLAVGATFPGIDLPKIALYPLRQELSTIEANLWQINLSRETCVGASATVPRQPEI